MTTTPPAITLAYIVAAILFILGIKLLGKVPTARLGNGLSAVGMLIAIVATVFEPQFGASENLDWAIGGLILALVIGTVLGVLAATKVQMTQMPEMVALLNGLGGLASLLVAAAESNKVFSTEGLANLAQVVGLARPAYGWELAVATQGGMAQFNALTIALTALVGAVTFTGSVVAWAKLAGKLPGKPVSFKGLRETNAALIVLALVLCAAAALLPAPMAEPLAFWGLTLLALVFGVTSVLPIGGGDMPVVISFLNSLSGVAACLAGFIILNEVLVVAGCLVGASGVILTVIMCKAMNRDLASVLLGGFGGGDGAAANATGQAEPKAMTADDAFLVLEAARNIVIVPGYGMAVAQAQHAVKELTQRLEANGAEVRFAIHPVAGRMPGHMNVLLAEADVPYEQLAEMDAINPGMPTVDVCMVIGANDVVNPAAQNRKGSPIYGMPIIKAHEARTVIVLKRGKGAGFAGIENDLFVLPNTRMLYGDAKSSISALAAKFKES